MMEMIYKSYLSSETALFHHTAQEQDSLLTPAQMSCYQLSIWRTPPLSSFSTAKLNVVSSLTNKTAPWSALMFWAKPLVAHCSSAANPCPLLLPGISQALNATGKHASTWNPLLREGHGIKSKQRDRRTDPSYELSISRCCLLHWWSRVLPCPRLAAALPQGDAPQRHGKAARQGWSQLQYADLSPRRLRFRRFLVYFLNQDTKISKLLARKEQHQLCSSNSAFQGTPSMLVCPGDVSHQTCICALILPLFFLARALFKMFECSEWASENTGSFYLCRQTLYCLPILNKTGADNLEMAIKFCWERFSVMDISIKDDCGCLPAVPYSAVRYTRTWTILNLLQPWMGNSPYRIWLQHTSIFTFPRRLCKTECQNVSVILH